VKNTSFLLKLTIRLYDP
jgi:hypothetical protein